MEFEILGNSTLKAPQESSVQASETALFWILQFCFIHKKYSFSL